MVAKGLRKVLPKALPKELPMGPDAPGMYFGSFQTSFVYSPVVTLPRGNPGLWARGRPISWF